MPPTDVDMRRAVALICLLTSASLAGAAAQSIPLTRAQAVQDAVARSPRSAILVADTASAFAQLLSARALPNPTLSAIYSKDTPNYHVTADFPVDYLWLRGTRVQVAELSRDAARYRFSFGRAIVALDADTTYTRALAAAARSRLSARTAQDTDSLRRMAVARRNAGDASELDVQLATVTSAQQANVAAADSLTAISTVLDLQAILGLPTDRLVIVLADSLTEPPVDAVVAQAGATLPVAAAQAALQSALLAARLQRRSLWSGAGIMFGVESGDPGGTGNALLPTFGVSLPLPFFDRNRGAIAQAEAERQRAEFELSLARIETQSQIAHADRERANALGRIVRDRVTVAAANQVASMSLTAYREGAMALPNVLEAQRTAREVLAQYVDDLAAAWIATAELRVFSMQPSPSRPQ
jgi:cobalt-zinc-cadmium efflux system outer membrane protein